MSPPTTAKCGSNFPATFVMECASEDNPISPPEIKLAVIQARIGYVPDISRIWQCEKFFFNGKIITNSSSEKIC